MIFIRRYSWENIREEEQKKADLNYGEVRLLLLLSRFSRV